MNDLFNRSTDYSVLRSSRHLYSVWVTVNAGEWYFQGKSVKSNWKRKVLFYMRLQNATQKCRSMLLFLLSWVVRQKGKMLNQESDMLALLSAMV